MATIVEVARRARVSPTTVSHVVNGTRFVSDVARARVTEAIASLGYRRNELARSLRRGTSHTLGLVLPDSANPFFAELGRAIELAAFEAGFSVILCNSENAVEKERLYLGVLSRRQVDGVVLVAAGERSDFLATLLGSGLPVLAMDRPRPGLAVDTVLADHRRGGWLATRHLLDVGHRRVACVAGPPGLSTSAQRVGGWRRALAEAGVPFDRALLVHGDFHPAAGASAARALLAQRRPPTAIFACNDLMAIGVLRAAAELGRRVPDDLAVVGYDDIELAAYAAPPLTTVAQPTRELGREVVRLVVNRIRDGRAPPQREVLPVALRVRESCGAREGRVRREDEAAGAVTERSRRRTR